MSLSTGYTWKHRDIHLVGYSMAGISTSLAFPDADVCFDVAQGLPFQIPYNNILITHGHMDHASGLPYLVGQKAMMGQLPPNAYMPENLLKPMREMMRLWESVDGHTYQYQFRSVRPGDERELKAPYFFRVFPTQHRVPSQGYLVYARKKRLKEEFRQLDSWQLGDLRKKGTLIEDPYEEPIVAFSGDTTIEFLDSPEICRARVLVIEVTYWDKAKTVENARQWGHIHLDELITRLETIQSEKIVLIHASARYSSNYLREILDARIPEHFKHRVELFPRPV
jgi:ribonuclease Z